MKKMFLLTILLFQLTFVFGQEPQWSPWTSVSCYKGIQYSINNLGYNKSTNSYWWNIKWKNNYSKAVSFDGVVTIDGESVIRGGWGNIQPGGIQTYTSVPYKSSSINFSVSVSKVCFSDKYGGCSETLEGWANYAECDNGTPNYKINGKNTVNSNINSTNQTNNSTQQNDLSEYNRSKADLERQMADKNAEIQRQNLETQRQQQLLKQQQDQQRQQYNNTVNQGSTNLQNGNYTEAMQSYTNAINSATTKSQKNLAATGTIISGIGGVFNALAKAKEEKRERERIEQEQKERELQQATNIMEANWDNAKTLAEQGDYNQATKLMLPYLNANKINAYSTSLIGFWYGQLKNYESAKICYEKALKLDSKSCAMHYLGDMYRYGQDVEVNYETALSYYKKSCENEDKTGCENYNKLKSLINDVIKK